MSVKAWFPTLVYDAPLLGGGASSRGAASRAAAKTASTFLREVLGEALQLREVDGEGQAWSEEHYPDGYTSYASLPKLHRMSPVFADLDQHLRRHITSFARSLEFDLAGRSLEMTDCWVNVMDRGSSHGLHLHPTSTISGTYYVQTPKGASVLQLEDPRLGLQMAAPTRKEGCGPRNRTFVKYPAEAGRVILFESWLRHSVPPSRIDGQRVSVSFNYH